MTRPELDTALAAEMARWEAAGLRRRLGASARTADFTTNDYLGLARHPDVIAGARRALEEHGAGGRASRLLGGGSGCEEALEVQAAHWLGSEAALLFPSGYQANLGVVGVLVGPGDAIVSDELNHASLIDAARLSRARILVHRHVDLDEVERLLLSARGARRRIVLTEGIFSMDGDAAPLARLNELCARHDAWLVVDEAHAAGVVGPEGAGAWAAAKSELRSAPVRLAARVVTGGKALGCGGAFVAGSSELRELLVNRARTFVYTTAPSPALVGALAAAIDVVRGADGLRTKLRKHAVRLAERFDLSEPAGAIVPFVLGDARAALAAEAELAAHGLVLRAVRPPTVPDGTARLRIVCHADNTAEEMDALIAALSPWTERRVRPAPARALAPTLVVAGTDTGIGKTVVAALLARGLGARYWKLVQTGPDGDTDSVSALAQPARPFPAPGAHFARPASPHEAARAEGRAVDPAALSHRLAELREEPGQLIVELAGGLLVPLTDDLTEVDWLARERLQLVLVARAGLGTLNHTLLSLEALRARHLEPRALFLVGPPHAENRATLAQLSGVEHILTLPPLEPLDTAALDRWLAVNDLEFLRET